MSEQGPEPDKLPDKLLTPAEVGVYFRVDGKTVVRWIKAGKLPAFRTLGGHHRIKASDVAALRATRHRP